MIYINDDIAALNLQAMLEQLSEQRREQALRYKHELGQKLNAAAYLLLCEALRSEYGIEEKPLFEYGEWGKPFIAGHPDIHFNLSHCRTAAICAVSQRPIGVDIETFRTAKDSLIRYTMNDMERARIASSPHPDMEFTRLWTQKEAKVKLAGEGIRKDMKEVLSGEEKFLTVVNFQRGYVYSVLETV
jgi:4'-phosphopantetheinyl transferase